MHASPLQWPAGIPRNRYPKSSNKFQVDLHQARAELYDELERIGATKVIISSNLQLNLDGRPASRQPWQADQGVAVYFTRKGRELCMACDQYDTYRGNLRGVGLCLEALRAIERHGGTSMMDAAFTGYAALPAGTSAPTSDPMGLLATHLPLSVIEQNYRTLAKQHHPDVGGDPALWRAIQTAYEQATATQRAS